MRAINLKTNHLTAPVGIDAGPLFLSWQCADGVRQTAYEIQLTANGEMLWHSGKTEGAAMHADVPAVGGSRVSGCWRGRGGRFLRYRRRHRSRGNLIRPSGGIGAFRRQRHARQQQLTDHKRTRTGASEFGTHTTPSTVNQRAGALTLSLLIEVTSVHIGLLGRRDKPPQRCLSPLWRSCTTKMCQMTPYA